MDLDPDLVALRSLGGFFVLHTGVPPHGPLPTLAEAYASPTSGAAGGVDADPIIFRVRKITESLRVSESRVAASLAHQGLAARLWAVALGSAALYGEVPDLRPGLLHWDPDGSAPHDLWLSEVHALPATAVDRVVRQEHLVPLTAALHTRYHVSARLLWGNAGSALAAAVRQIDHWATSRQRPEVAHRTRALAAGLFAHPDLAGTLDPASGRRRSCCLYYRVPGGGLCGDCCFTRPPRSSPHATSG